jgi:hypothetical protein
LEEFSSAMKCKHFSVSGRGKENFLIRNNLKLWFSEEIEEQAMEFNEIWGFVQGIGRWVFELIHFLKPFSQKYPNWIPYCVPCPKKIKISFNVFFMPP